MFNFTRKTFARCCWNSFQRLLFHHQFLFILLSGSHRLSQFHPLFYNPFTFPRRSKTSQWEWIGMREWCVCSDVSVCFMTLASLNEREEVFPVIYSDQLSCPICARLHRFALSHSLLPILFTFHILPHFLPLHFLFDLQLTGVLLSVNSHLLDASSSSSIWGIIHVLHSDTSWNQNARKHTSETCKFINRFTADNRGFHLVNDSSRRIRW